MKHRVDNLAAEERSDQLFAFGANFLDCHKKRFQKFHSAETSIPDFSNFNVGLVDINFLVRVLL